MLFLKLNKSQIQVFWVQTTSSSRKELPFPSPRAFLYFSFFLSMLRLFRHPFLHFSGFIVGSLYLYELIVKHSECFDLKMYCSQRYIAMHPFEHAYSNVLTPFWGGSGCFLSWISLLNVGMIKNNLQWMPSNRKGRFIKVSQRILIYLISPDLLLCKFWLFSEVKMTMKGKSLE